MSNYSDQIRNSGLMETLHDNWVDEQMDKDFKAKGGGFFDLPKQQTCNHPEHEAPKHLCIPQGKGYRHICPKCGRVQEIIPQQITL
jgi:hypothetical protein